MALFSIFYLSFCFVTLTCNIFRNRWQWHLYLCFFEKILHYLFIQFIFLLIFIFYFVIFLFFSLCFLLLSLLLFVYYYYESVDLFGKKGIPLIDLPRMLRFDEVYKHSYIFSNLSIQPGHKCFVITGMVSSCYGRYSILLIFCLLVE